jgi:hypothetical protein
MTTATTVMPTRDVTIGDTFVRISGQGFRLVFVHGFTTTSEFWREQTEKFSKKELWAFHGNRIAVRFAYESHGDSGNWFRSYGTRIG